MPKISLDPYIFFQGNAREAMEFYQSVFGGELTIRTYGDVHAVSDETPAEQVMHAALEGGMVQFYASDTAKASPVAKKISLCLGGKDEDELRTIFDALSQDVEVLYPLKKESWGDIFGSVTDRYGIEWMVNIESGR